MKYKSIEKLIFFIFILTVSRINSINELQIASSKSWCWTKPIINDPSFILNESNGGINWGYCKFNAETILKKKIYFIYVSTSTILGSGTSSKLFITLEGTDGKSKEQILSPKGFKLGSFERVKIFANDVGNLQSIKIRNAGSHSYRCNTIKIESGINYWNFECNGVIKCPNCTSVYPVVNLVTYEINVKTSSTENSGTREPIYIKFIGSRGKSPEKLLSEKGFDRGSLIQIQIDTIDVGSVFGITLFIKGYDIWRPEELNIKKPGSNLGIEEKIFKIPPNTVIDSPAKPFTIKIQKPESSSSNEEVQALSNSYSLLDSKEQHKVIKLACTDVVKDNDIFGPNYVGTNVNFFKVYAECPSNCHLIKTRAIGLGIHPEESPICINALVDRAMSFYGGLILISIYRGLPSYTGGKKIFGFPVLSHGASKKSYTISKIENIDMISMDVRILDSDGKSSYKGRLEIRNDGVWGTICAKDLDNSSAMIICKQIGYKGGKFLNPTMEKGKGFCSNFQGFNLCGPNQSSQIFSNLKCQGNEESIMQCYRTMADRTICSHDYDTLIECSNSSQDEVGSYQTGTVRLIDATGNPSKTGIGRIEILKENWGTFCNTKFTNKSAKVVCKQMGFLDGKIFGESESLATCSNVLGNDLCGQYNTPIKYTEVICLGHEKNIRDCSSKSNTVSCTHFNDVVVKCEGYGDPSGRSQNIRTPKVLSPLIEKFPMMPVFNAKCESNASQIHFRGDPGSIFLVQCPSECSQVKSIVTGTGIYAVTSSICKAAIQSGIITDEGGLILLSKTYGQNKYFGSIVRNISSQDSNYRKISFFLSSPNSAYLNMVAMINNASFIELNYTEKLVKKNSKISTFLEFLKTPKSKYNTLASSFIEVSSGSNLESIFDWVTPNNEFRFDGSKKYIDLMLQDGSKKLLSLKTFTIFTKLKLKEFKDDIQVIFSIGGCQGYSIEINKNSEIVFNVQCGKKLYQSGIYMPLRHTITISIVYNISLIMFYLNGMKFSSISTYFETTPTNQITLGRHSNFDKWFFNGFIEFIAFFPEPFGILRNRQLFKMGYTKPIRKYPNKFITLDNRSCLTACAIQTIPGMNGCPSPPDEALKYQINGEIQMIKGVIGGESIEDKINNDISALREVTCRTTPRQLLGEEIKVGDRRRVKCPAHCKKESKQIIFGTILYTLDSSICRSAIHSGIIKDDGGNVMIKVMQGLKYYIGSNQFGIQSTGISNSLFSFTIEMASQVLTLSCKTAGTDNLFSSKIGMKFLVKCPVDCSKISHNVFGNLIYSGDSSICQSAIHSGLLNDRGGEVNFMTAKGLNQYFGIKAYGVQSKNRDSYVSSFKFFGTNKQSSMKYKEEFNSQFVSNNWDIVDNLEANNYPSNWEYVKSPFNTKFPFIMHQSSKIKSGLPYSYGTIILLKKADIVNFLFEVNLYFVNMNPIGIIFRYKDENNYYNLRINNLGPYKMLLIKFYEGKSIILASSAISLTPRLWYNFSLGVYFDQISVNLQIGQLRNNQQIFDVKDNDLQRGSLGIASNGNNDFYVGSIFIDNYISNRNYLNNYNKFKRTFETVLQENTENHRQKYCKSLFENNLQKLIICKEFHNYCRLKCNDEIHRRENVLNYICYKSCIRDSYQKNKLANMNLNETSFRLNPSLWIPNEKETCDYKPDDLGPNSIWVPCKILQVSENPNDPEQKILKVTYEINKSEKTVSLLFPTTVLKKCGQAIVSRKDCKQQ